MGATKRVELRVPADDLARWTATAGIRGLLLSEWIRQQCNEGAIDEATIDEATKRLDAKRKSNR